MFSGFTAQAVRAAAQQRLVALRAALESCSDLHEWVAGQASADLESIGFSTADAATLTSAMADAAALDDFYTTGLPPSTYPQPPSAYVYGATQRQVIGPQ